MFTAHSLRLLETLSAQRILGFSFTVETRPPRLSPAERDDGGQGTVNENHPKLRFIWFVSQNTTISIESMIRWVPETVGLAVSLPEGLGFISFRPPPPCGMRSLFLRGQRKEIRKIPLRTPFGSEPQGRRLRLKRSGRLTFKDLNKASA